jgi:hypothetical protein
VIQLDPQHLLFMEPRQPASRDPIIDDYTRRMAGALRVAEIPPRSTWNRGRHDCICRMSSACYDLDVATTHGTLKTNSLAVHYLAHHRGEVPESELAKVLTLTAPPLDPLPTELTRDMTPLPLPR